MSEQTFHLEGHAKRWYSINQFMDGISNLLGEGVSYVNVYFDDWTQTKFNWSVKPIGFAVIYQHEVKKLSYYDVHKAIPEMEFIQFKESKDKKMSELGNARKLFKLVIKREEDEYKGFPFHKSSIKEANQSIYKRVQKDYDSDRMKYLNELADKCPDEVEDEEEIPDLDFI